MNALMPLRNVVPLVMLLLAENWTFAWSVAALPPTAMMRSTLRSIARREKIEVKHEGLPLATAAAPGFRIVIISDCSAQQKWMAHLFVSSAREVGQTDPITWVRANCPEHKADTANDAALLQQLNPYAELIDLQVKGNMPDKTWIKPAAMQAFLDSKTDLPDDTVVTMTDTDMIFLTKHRVHDLGSRAIPANITSSISYPYSANSTSFVQGRVGAAQHYECCEGIGAPYILTAGAWRALNQEWEKMRLAIKGEVNWGSDQMAFAVAAQKVGVRFNIFNHFAVSDVALGEATEGMPWVQDALRRGHGDTCATGLVGDASLAEDARDVKMPTFLHVVRPWGLRRLGWLYSKYQVPPGFGKPADYEGILECAMPLMAEPPKNLTLLAKDSAEEMHAWGLCTITHSLNSMLQKFKAAKCGDGAFNKAFAIKFKDDWENELLPGGTNAISPASKLWVKRCAEHVDCRL